MRETSQQAVAAYGCWLRDEAERPHRLAFGEHFAQQYGAEYMLYFYHESKLLVFC